MIKFQKQFAIVIAVGLGVFAMVARAQDGLQLTNAVFQDVEVRGKDGKVTKKTVPVTKTVPGGEVMYVITYKNTGSSPASKVVIDNPVPPQLVYKAGSAAGTGTKVEVSVDGGANYGVLVSLKVNGEDGKPRPAQPADVTHLRWSLSGAVAPGKEGTVSYRATLK